MAITARVVHVLLPFFEAQVAGRLRPAFDRHVGRDRVKPVRERPAVQVRLVRVIEKWNRQARLLVRHEHVVHFIKGAQGLAAREQIAFDLRNHRSGIRQQRPTRNVFIPRARHRHDLHRRDDGIRGRRIEQDRRRDHRGRSEDSAFLIDPLPVRGQRKGKRTEDEPKASDRKSEVHCFSRPLETEQQLRPEAAVENPATGNETRPCS
ncbi:MAG: hypothetical protein H0T83_05050 [Chthoniobacterales bacterium]|nr:hypothetical protein [Chthoniobacterales bacterium]